MQRGTEKGRELIKACSFNNANVITFTGLRIRWKKENNRRGRLVGNKSIHNMQKETYGCVKQREKRGSMLKSEPGRCHGGKTCAETTSCSSGEQLWSGIEMLNPSLNFETLSSTRTRSLSKTGKLECSLSWLHVYH